MVKFPKGVSFHREANFPKASNVLKCPCSKVSFPNVALHPKEVHSLLKECNSNPEASTRSQDSRASLNLEVHNPVVSLTQEVHNPVVSLTPEASNPVVSLTQEVHNREANFRPKAYHLAVACQANRENHTPWEEAPCPLCSNPLVEVVHLNKTLARDQHLWHKEQGCNNS
mgnify:FL=1